MILNSSPLIIFSKLNKLDLLKKLFDNLEIPMAVYKEVVEKGISINAPNAFLIKDFIDKKIIQVKILRKESEKKAQFLTKIYSQLDIGEAEAIALALERKEDYLIIDDKVATKIARLYKLKPIGSLRVLLIAFKKKLISEQEIKLLIIEMCSKEFRLSSDIINKFWTLFEKIKNTG